MHAADAARDAHAADAGSALARTRLPAWPGPVLSVVGFLVLVGALGVADGAIGPGVSPVAREAAQRVAVAAGISTALGLIYTLARQLRRRRTLGVDRYRGPSVMLMLALSVGLGVGATIPFAADSAALFGGDGEPSTLGVIVLVTSLQLVLVLVSWLFVFRERAVAFAAPILSARPVAALRSGVGWGVIAWFGATAVSVAAALLLSMLGITPEPDAAEQVLQAAQPWIVVPAIVIVAPVAEEIFFRGVVFNAWLRERGTRFAYIGSALLFAAIHVSLLALVPIFVLGLALAWVYRRTGNLLAPIAMHATVNAISIALALLVAPRLPG